MAMETVNICRCCLTSGSHKNLSVTYVWLGKPEVYFKMIKDCYNVTLQQYEDESSNTICDACIRMVRSSLQFRNQVLQSEHEFQQRLKVSEGTDNMTLIKVEPQVQGDIYDSDDLFLSDTVKEVSVDIKSEPLEKKAEHKRVKHKKKKPLTTSKKRSEKIRSLVSRLAKATSIELKSGHSNVKQEPDDKLAAMFGIDNLSLQRRITGHGTKKFLNIEPLKKNINFRKKIFLKTEFNKKTQVNFLWNKPSLDKRKYLDNLQTILIHSNATPFKTKSLLGYVCGFCENSYSDPEDLRAHSRDQHTEERHEYKNDATDITEHTIKLDIEDLTCILCFEKLENLIQLKAHLAECHKKIIHNDIKDKLLQFKLKKGDLYDCTLCTSTYETFKMLLQHMNVHYSNYSCDSCDASFSTKRSLSAHKGTHENGSFKCEFCDKVFSSKPKKLYHERINHRGTKIISKCPYCDEPFRSYYQRNSHLIKVHNTEAQYKCNICDKSYILKSILMCHIKKNHLMERNHQCVQCGYKFFSKKALKVHMVKHTGERNYSCEVCHKTYARKYTLREHMRIHNNDRRFKCEVCGMTFVQKCSLKSHLLSNHGISMAASDIKKPMESVVTEKTYTFFRLAPIRSFVPNYTRNDSANISPFRVILNPIWRTIVVCSFKLSQLSRRTSNTECPCHPVNTTVGTPSKCRAFIVVVTTRYVI